MKRQLVLSIFAAIALIGGLSGQNVASAQFSEDFLIESIDEIPMEGEVTDHESDPAVEEQNLREEFRGVDLTAEQFEQVRQARRQFRDEMTQILSEDFGSVLQLVFLPQAEAESRSVNVLGNPIVNYGNALSEILTPEQIEIWQKNMEADAERSDF